MVEVIQAAQQRLDKLLRKQGGLSPLLHGQGILNMQFAQEDYGWLDILVQTKLHQFLHMVLGAGLAVLPGNAALQKQAFHISIRTSSWTRLRRVDASDGQLEVPAAARARSAGAA